MYYCYLDTPIGELLLDLQQQEETLLVCVTHSMELANLMSR